MRIEPRPYDHPDSCLLIDEVQQEYVVRYGSPDETPVDPAEFAPPLGRFYVGYLDGRPLVMGGWRDHGDGTAEIKRMYVSPDGRGKGLAREMLAHLELAAAEAGIGRLILETGLKQPEAVALYRSSGYADIDAFGHYAEHELSVHLGKEIACPSTPSAT
ncbi:GNAT family N-acetyltransferase [Actinokineospora sp. HUAS TT18]|uniref:GNAT family N-acetyltransferase n=1 Tax=Actinokineospora sp. HUAS TT18 TaxID=3447451 RepID=UPI003F51F55E